MTVRLLGVNVRLDFRLVSMLVLFALFDEAGFLKYSLAAMTIHECGHLAALFLTGDKPSGLDFLPGGMVIHTGRPLGCTVVLGGIAANILSASLLLPIGGRMCTLGLVNFVFGAVSLIPARPLDGFAALELLTDGLPFGGKVCGCVSAASGAMLFCAGIYMLLSTGRNFSLLILSFWLMYDILENCFVKGRSI